MKHASTPEGLATSRQHLFRRLLEQLERTFTTEGQETALLFVADLLEHLDDDAMRAFAYQHGIRSEDEFEEEAGPERGTTPAGTV
jgi:hypothetical protein